MSGIEELQQTPSSRNDRIIKKYSSLLEEGQFDPFRFRAFCRISGMDFVKPRERLPGWSEIDQAKRDAIEQLMDEPDTEMAFLNVLIVQYGRYWAGQTNNAEPLYDAYVAAKAEGKSSCALIPSVLTARQARALTSVQMEELMARIDDKTNARALESKPGYCIQQTYNAGPLLQRISLEKPVESPKIAQSPCASSHYQMACKPGSVPIAGR